MGRSVAVLGGGHGAQTLAADLTLGGHEVRLFELASFRHQIADVFATGTVRAVGDILEGTAELAVVTDDIDEAVPGAEVVFVAVPAFGHGTYAELLSPIVMAGQLVVLLPGTLGTFAFAHAWRRAGADTDTVLAEADTFPYATRALEPGLVRVYGRTTVGLGVLPARRSEWAAQLMRDLLPFTLHRDVLAAGLSSINPVLHPPGTVLNAGRIERSRGEFYIYEEGMTPSVTRVVDALDGERRALAKAFGLELPTVAEALNEAGYGPGGSTWEALNGSASLTPIKGPTSLRTRYLSEDLPFGLATWASLAGQVGVATPVMEAMTCLGLALIGGDAPPSRTVDELGLAGMDAAAITDVAQHGFDSKPKES